MHSPSPNIVIPRGKRTGMIESPATTPLCTSVYHFQCQFLDVKSCLFCPSVLYVFLRHFMDLYGHLHHFYAYLRHFCVCGLGKVQHFERSCRFHLKCYGQLQLSQSCLNIAHCGFPGLKTEPTDLLAKNKFRCQSEKTGTMQRLEHAYHTLHSIK